MFRKSNKDSTEAPKLGSKAMLKKELTISVIAQDMNILGNVVCEGNVDFNGTIDGNIRCGTVTIRPHGVVRGEVIADNVFVFGRVQGLIRAKNVHLYADSQVEGIVMHENLKMEDGAFLDGKCKRTDKIAEVRPAASLDGLFTSEEDSNDSGGAKPMENIRLIR